MIKMHIFNFLTKSEQLAIHATFFLQHIRETAATHMTKLRLLPKISHNVQPLKLKVHQILGSK